MRVGGEPASRFTLDLDDLLSELRRRRWTLIRWGERDFPALLAAMFQWDACADVLILRSAEDASGYRVPTVNGSDVFNPEVVSYQYHSTSLWALRAMLSLPAPGRPGAPVGVEIPRRPECVIPEDLPQPIVIRPLSPYPR